MHCIAKHTFILKLVQITRLIDNLLNVYCGKNKTKRNKVIKAYESIVYDSKTKEYTVDSVTKVDKKYIAFWSTAAKEWFCTCESAAYQPYQTFEDLKKRLYGRKKYQCCHIISCQIHKLLKKS